MRPFLFLSLIFIGSFGFAASVVSESVGQVGDRTLTSREVQISSVIEKILEPEKDLVGLNEVHPGDSKFPAEVTSLLLETVVSIEAESFGVAQINTGQLKTSLEKIEKATKGKPYWDNLEVGSKELEKLARQKLIAKNFIKLKTESMGSIVTDREAMSYYEKNRMKFGNIPFSSFRESIKTYLSRQQLQERLRSWFEVIKRKYKVRNFAAESASS